MSYQLKGNGFTLSEVLIALALLGIIAAFAIPKVLQSTQNAERNAKMLETISAIQQIIEEGRLKGELNPNNEFEYFKARLNALKACNVGDDGDCHSGQTSGGSSEFTSQTFVLPNGVVIAGVNNCCGMAPMYQQNASTTYTIPMSLWMPLPLTGTATSRPISGGKIS